MKKDWNSLLSFDTFCCIEGVIDCFLSRHRIAMLQLICEFARRQCPRLRMFSMLGWELPCSFSLNRSPAGHRQSYSASMTEVRGIVGDCLRAGLLTAKRTAQWVLLLLFVVVCLFFFYIFVRQQTMQFTRFIRNCNAKQNYCRDLS